MDGSSNIKRIEKIWIWKRKRLKKCKCGGWMLKAEFDDIAERYSAMMEKGMVLKGNGHEYFTAYKMYYLKEYIQACRNRHPKSAVKVLDYGCGIGIVSRAIAESFGKVIVHGFDISSESIKCANEIKHGKNVMFTNNADSLDDDYDMCICCCVLHHVPAGEKQNEVIRNIYHRLKKGGIFIVIEHNMKNPLTRKSVYSCPFDKNAVMLTEREVVHLMEKHSFQNISKRYITFFPKQLSKLRAIDKYLKWCVLGAQHMETGYKHPCMGNRAPHGMSREKIEGMDDKKRTC